MAVDRVKLVRQGFETWNSEDAQWVLDHMSPPRRGAALRATGVE